MANRLASSNIILLDTYFTWNTTTNNYDRLSVVSAGTLVINRAYWIYVNSLANTITGKVIDGYIKNALVFQDINGNGRQDLNKPSTTTDSNGNYTLDIDFTLQL